MSNVDDDGGCYAVVEVSWMLNCVHCVCNHNIIFFLQSKVWGVGLGKLGNLRIEKNYRYCHLHVRMSPKVLYSCTCIKKFCIQESLTYLPNHLHTCDYCCQTTPMCSRIF